MSSILELQDWYSRQCNGVWEHGCGIQIETLDNPGWSLKVDLRGTNLESAPFTAREHGGGSQSISNDSDWWITKVEDGIFTGYSGPGHLKTLLDIFLRWARQ